MTPLVLLLDEPDSFLPPVGVSALLARLLGICLRRGWQIVLTTHSEELISLAIEEAAFTLLRVDENGATVAITSSEDSQAGLELLSRPPVDHVFYCEDETARLYVTTALLNEIDPRLARSSSVVWGGGDGYMKKLKQSLPRPPRPDIHFRFVFDGDQRGSVESTSQEWPALFLPVPGDPDTALRGLASDVPRLATVLGVRLNDLSQLLDSLQGMDAHDWVNALGESYGRNHALTVLAALWVDANRDAVQENSDSTGNSDVRTSS